MSSRPTWYTVKGFAEEIGRDERTVRRWIADGRINYERVAAPGSRASGRIRINKSEIARCVTPYKSLYR